MRLERAVVAGILLFLVSTSGPAVARQQQPSVTDLGRLLGVARGCEDRKALGALTSCLQRFVDKQATSETMRKSLVAAAEKAQKSPWLERPGVCARALIAVREMPLWKTLCKDLGPPPY